MDPMRYVLFGRSGLRVSELCLGTMTFGTDWGWGADEAECGRIFRTFAEAGGNFVDTACNYTDGTSEEIVGRLVAPDRDRWVVATKYTLTMDKEDPNAGGNHRKSLVRTLEGSLRRLGTDYVDLLWLHMRDATTPIEEAVRALDDQVRAGKVLYVGISDSPSWVAAQANTIADLRGWTPFVGLQLPYSLASRSPERELLPMARTLGLAVTPWGVLDHGILAGRDPSTLRWPSDSVPERLRGLVEAVGDIAASHGATMSQVAIAWLLHRPDAPTIVPIVGVRTAEQLTDNLGALAVSLTTDDVARLDGALPLELGFPRSFLESSDVRELIYGDTWARLRTA
jgi:aryl-alcohol dehydrogenase-like predicted oxidoreductase